MSFVPLFVSLTFDLKILVVRKAMSAINIIFKIGCADSKCITVIHLLSLKRYNQAYAVLRKTLAKHNT